MSAISEMIDASDLPGVVMKYILPWFEVFGEAIRIGRQVIGGLSTEGTYEVLGLQHPVGAERSGR